MIVYISSMWADSFRCLVRQGRKPALQFKRLRHALEYVRETGRKPSVRWLKG